MESYDDNTNDVLILAPGARIAHYRITRPLGAGGMAEVFLAEDSRLKRKVALKFLSPKLAVDASFKARFMREAQSAAVLNHPNIITIYEVAEFMDRVYIAMEFVEGKSLRDLMDSGTMSTDQALDLALQLCDGLRAAHRAGVVHRDIKPGNIIVGIDGRVRLLDFGLAKAEGDEQLTQTGTALGTADYMSPEQGQGKEADARSDIFSMGVLLYELIAKKLPFRRANMPATIYAIIHEQPEPLTKHAPQIPARLEAVVKKALAKNPNDRYQETDELLNDLRSATNRSAVLPAMSVMTSAQQLLPIRSVGVLYLRNLGPTDDEYLAYGITEDLIVDLTRLGTIRVPPMRSVLKYKDSDDELETLAEKLNVEIILDGSIVRTGEGLRVSAQMINVATNETLWAERWEQPINNLPEVKKALAEGISSAIGLGMTQVRVAGVGVPEAKDAGAYDKYLKGKFSFDHKRDKSDVDIALGLYRQALKEEPSLLAARAGVAEILSHQGQFSAARIEIESALKEVKGADHRADQANLLRLLARVHIKHSAWEEAWKVAGKAEAISQELNDKDGEALALGIQISILQPQAKFDEMLEKFDRVLEIARDLDDQERIAEALKNMGVAYARKGEYDRAMMMYEEALEISRKTDNLSLQAACLANTGNVYLFRGQLEQALAFYRDSLEMSENLGDLSGAARQTLNIGLVQLQRGELRSGFEHLKRSADAFEELGEHSYLAMNMANLGHAELSLGKLEEARADLERALQLGKEFNIPLTIAISHQRLGTYYFLKGDLETARENYQAALDVVQERGLTRNEAVIHLDLAKVAMSLGDLKVCQAEVKKAEALSREIGDKLALCMATAMSGLLTVKSGLFRVGLRTIEQQVDLANRIEDIHLVIHVRSIFGEALFTGGDARDKERGEQLLRETLATAREKEFVPEADRIEKLLATG